MKILILNGANLNLQGKRDKGVYGCESFDTFIPRLQALYSDIEIDYRQTNIEGEIVDYLHRAEVIMTVCCSMRAVTRTLR